MSSVKPLKRPAEQGTGSCRGWYLKVHYLSVKVALKFQGQLPQLIDAHLHTKAHTESQLMRVPRPPFLVVNPHKGMKGECVWQRGLALRVGAMYPRRVDACGKEVFAIRGQFQAVTGGWKL